MIAPFNIVFYNIFTSHGPDLYGTEHWSFYLLNGVLNFNVVFILSITAPFIILLLKVSTLYLITPHYYFKVKSNVIYKKNPMFVLLLINFF